MFSPQAKNLNEVIKKGWAIYKILKLRSMNKNKLLAIIGVPVVFLLAYLG